MYRVEVCHPEGVWTLVGEYDYDPTQDALAPADPLPAGTCVRITKPNVFNPEVHVVVSDGTLKPLLLDLTLASYLGFDSCVAWHTDPISWLGLSEDGRNVLKLASFHAEPGSQLHRHVVRATCACARFSLFEWHRVYRDDDGPLRVIEAAEKWSHRDAELTDVQNVATRMSHGSFFEARAREAAAAAYGTAEACQFPRNASAVVSSVTRAMRSPSEVTLSHCAHLIRERIPLREVLVAMAEKGSVKQPFHEIGFFERPSGKR